MREYVLENVTWYGQIFILHFIYYYWNFLIFIRSMWNKRQMHEKWLWAWKN